MCAATLSNPVRLTCIRVDKSLFLLFNDDDDSRMGRASLAGFLWSLLLVPAEAHALRTNVMTVFCLVARVGPRGAGQVL